VLESAGVGVWLDRVCVYGSLGEQVNPSHMRVHCAGVWRVSSVRGIREWSVCARAKWTNRGTCAAPRTALEFGAPLRHRMTLLRTCYISDHVHPSSFRLRDRAMPRGRAPLAPRRPRRARKIRIAAYRRRSASA
jgi:hypothetical protein